MTQLNEHQTPPGGWIFYQPETKWRNPTPIASTLSQTVMLIIAMRKANPAITAKFKLATNPEAVKAEVLKFNRRRLGLPEDNTPVPFRAPHSTSRNAAAGAVGVEKKVDAMAGLKRAAQGTGVVLAWLGGGAVPVEKELAEKRAATCVACPMNQAGEWFTVAPAETIKKSVEAWKSLTGKSDFSFATTQGDKLKSCAVCKCLLEMKVWVGLEHIVSKTPEEVMKEFPRTCWIANRDA